MKRRYYVSPCDDLGSLGDQRRQRTWDVVDRVRKAIVSNHDKRIWAREQAEKLNANWAREQAEKLNA